MPLSDPVLIASEFSTNAVTGPATRSVNTTVATNATDVILAAVMVHGASPTDTAVVSGGSLTWTKIRTATYSGSGNHRLTLFAATGAMSSGTTLSYGPGGTFAATGTDLVVLQVPGGTEPIASDTASNAASTDPISVSTTGITPSVGASDLVVLFGNMADATAYSSGTGTEIADGTHSAPVCRMGAYWDRTSPANPMTMTNGVSAAWVGIAVRVTEAGGGSSVALASSITAQSGASGTLSGGNNLHASITAQSGASGTLTSTSANPTLVATVNAVSTAGAAITHVGPLRAAITVTSTANAPKLLMDRPLSASIDVISATDVLLRKAQPIAASVLVQSAAWATLYRPGNWEVYINGVNRTAYVRPFDAINIVNRIFEGSGTATIPIRDDTGTLGITTEMDVEIIQREDRLFKGIVRRITRSDYGWSTGPRSYTLECQDYTTLLDDDVIETGYRSAVESDKSRLTWIVSTHGTRGITAGAEVKTILASMPVGEDGRPEQDFSGKTLREAIEDVANLSGGRYYVDYDKKLHYFATESAAAPYELSDAYNGTTSVGYWNLRLNDDTIDLCHEVLVVGTGVKVWRTVSSPPPVGQRRRAVIRDENVYTTAQANELGDAYLSQYGTARNTGTVMTRAPGFRAGQVVNVTHSGHGLSAEPFLIASVTASTNGPEEVDFQLELGDAQLDLGDVIGLQRRKLAALAAQVANQGEQIDGLEGGVNLLANSSFERSSTTGWSIGSGWTFGHSVSDAYHESKVGRLVRSSGAAATLTTAKVNVDRTSDYWFSAWSWLRSRSAGSVEVRVVEYNSGGTVLTTTVIGTRSSAGSTWTRDSIRFGPTEQTGRRAFHANTAQVAMQFANVGTSTLTYDVDGIQIERGTILTAYSPRSGEVLPGSVGPDEIADNAITRTKISPGSIETPHLAANSVTADQIDADAVQAEHIAADAIQAEHIDVDAVRAEHIAANAITTDNLVAGQVAIRAANGDIILDPNAEALQIIGQWNMGLGSVAAPPAGQYTQSTATQPLGSAWNESYPPFCVGMVNIGAGKSVLMPYTQWNAGTGAMTIFYYAYSTSSAIVVVRVTRVAAPAVNFRILALRQGAING